MLENKSLSKIMEFKKGFEQSFGWADFKIKRKFYWYERLLKGTFCCPCVARHVHRCMLHKSSLPLVGWTFSYDGSNVSAEIEVQVNSIKNSNAKKNSLFHGLLIMGPMFCLSALTCNFKWLTKEQQPKVVCVEDGVVQIRLVQHLLK